MDFDKIYIKDLLLRCIIGINDDERVKKQDVVINIILYADLNKAAVTDDIQYTVDYKKIKTNIVRLVENSSFFLVEKLAAEIADTCLKNVQVKKVTVFVEKPGALRFAKTVGVEITRTKHET